MMQPLYILLHKSFYRFSLYFGRLFYVSAGCIIAGYVLAYFYSGLLQLSNIALLCLLIAVLIDFVLVFAGKKPVTAWRVCADRFSNGDNNTVIIIIRNHRTYSIIVEVLDELPFQFPQEGNKIRVVLREKEQRETIYHLRPVERGEYNFGIINLFLQSPLRLLYRHLKAGSAQIVSVYPSFLQLRQFTLQSVTSDNSKGSRQIRKMGSSLEFEQIKEYVPGDDYRTINWQATARRSSLMINTYMDERSQQVICVLDKGRNMKMPFAGMTLLDYAINAILMLSNVVLQKQDKAGLITYNKTVDQFVRADKQRSHMMVLLETLYRQDTMFADSNTEALYGAVRQHLRQRSLLILFTNFESLYGLQRQLPYLKKLSSYHALLVVLFENTALKELEQQPAATLEAVYDKVIAGKFLLEKRQMVKELQAAGIMALLTPPHQLTVNVINKYLEVKARHLV